MSAPPEPLLFAEALAEEQEHLDPPASLTAEVRARREELEQELADVTDVDERRRRVDSRLAGDLYRSLHAGGVQRAALCVSGGGIRSATFGLGVLQGLAHHGLLRRFDYLSTVSGGGYLGSWLSAWIHRQVEARGSSAAAVAAVEKALAGGVPPAPDRLCPEPEPLRHLRSFSRYMSPRFGLLSADTWTLVATYLRNLILNWLVLLPLLALLLAPSRFRIWFANHRPEAQEVWWSVFWVATACGVAAIAYIIANRPSLIASGVSRFPARLRSQPWFQALCLAPLSVMVLALSVFWAWVRWEGDVQFELAGRPLSMPVAFLLFGALLHFGGYLLSRVWVRSLSLLEGFGVLLSGALGGLLSSPIALWFKVREGDHLAPFYAVFAGPLVLALFLLATTLFVGIASRRLNDADREWLARGGAWMLIAVVVGGGVNAIVLFGPPLLAYLPQLFAPLGTVSGAATVLLGRSSRTAAQQAQPGTASLASKLAGAALKLAPPLFVVLLFAALSLGTTMLVRGLARGTEWPSHADSRFDRYDLVGTFMHSPGVALVAAALALLVVVVLMGSRVDINRFSLHGAYRDRLIRAYLGASRLAGTRRPDPMTGFDEEDNVQLHALRGNRPLQVVNIALNLVHGGNLAWQDRKAESFTATPLHCGSWVLGYRDSTRYGAHPGTDRAISLGTALAISGAAASPNMGYHSSPIVTFLLALFNVRLGWWLGNPGRYGAKTYDQPGPRFAPRPLLSETFGLTDDEHPYVYLSDGGHFDNLGIYEMVLRRCRWIVALDGEGDPQFRFGGLGAVTAKLRADFGVPITFDDPPPMRPYDANQPPPPVAERTPYYAVGRIGYSCVDGTPVEDDGWLLYIKASLNGGEPVDVVNYARSNPAFPHESTSDQQYSESQFESYRALGRHAAGEVLTGLPSGSDFAAMFQHLQSRRGAPPPDQAQ